MRVEGGSAGFQIGASETDVVLPVMNDGGMKHLLSDKFTIGGEATAAGPIGRDATTQTNAMMRAARPRIPADGFGHRLNSTV
jgi:lipid-binding SYLF domain-containing protein